MREYDEEEEKGKVQRKPPLSSRSPFLSFPFLSFPFFVFFLIRLKTNITMCDIAAVFL